MEGQLTVSHVSLTNDNKLVEVPLEHPAGIQHKDEGEEKMNPKNVGIIDLWGDSIVRVIDDRLEALEHAAEDNGLRTCSRV